MFSPSLLLVTNDFTWTNFLIAFIGCTLGISCLGAAISGFMLVRTAAWERLLLTVAAVLLVVPELISSLVGVVLIIPVLARQFTGHRTAPAL